MRAASDTRVWEFAKTEGYVVVSKDSDMHDLSLVLGLPPKVVWVRLGNCSTHQVELLLRQDFGVIELFYLDEEVSLLALP